MNSLSVLLWGIVLSVLPITELRGGIPFALAQGINPFIAFIFCVAANIMVISFLFLFLDYFHVHLLKTKFYRRTFNAFLKKLRTHKINVEKNYQTYGFIALTIFTAIPLPVTGAWTATIIAWLLNLQRKKSFLAIAFGVIIAGIVVTLITLGVITMFKFMI